VYDGQLRMSPLPLVLRLLIAALSAAVVLGDAAAPAAVAHAAVDDDDEDDDGEDEEDGGEAEDDDDDEDGDKDTARDEKDQPPVTAGGLFTKKTYPVAENARPLTLIEGMLELQAGFNIDLSDRKAFETWFANLRGRYGLLDHVELQFGAVFKLAGLEGGAAGPNKARLDLGIEPAIVYDLVDFRFTVEMPLNPGSDSQDAFKMDLVLGFPFRYRPAKQFAIVALDRLMTIHAVGGGKPDLTAGVGFVIQPADIVAILLRGEITIPRFDTRLVLIPATAAVQLSPSNQFDVGLEFTFFNIKPTDDEKAAWIAEQQAEGEPMPAELSPIDKRFLLLYGAARF
jgi:hypothetical protein